MKMEQSISEGWHIKFRRRVITQEKAYNIQNKAKVWILEFSLSSILLILLSLISSYFISLLTSSLHPQYIFSTSSPHPLYILSTSPLHPILHIFSTSSLHPLYILSTSSLHPPLYIFSTSSLHPLYILSTWLIRIYCLESITFFPLTSLSLRLFHNSVK
jgi:hypothetical protein